MNDPDPEVHTLVECGELNRAVAGVENRRKTFPYAFPKGDRDGTPVLSVTGSPVKATTQLIEENKWVESMKAVSQKQQTHSRS